MLALKRKETLTRATTWMNLEDMMLIEISIKRQIVYDSTHIMSLA